MGQPESDIAFHSRMERTPFHLRTLAERLRVFADAVRWANAAGQREDDLLRRFDAGDFLTTVERIEARRIRRLRSGL